MAWTLTICLPLICHSTEPRPEQQSCPLYALLFKSQQRRRWRRRLPSHCSWKPKGNWKLPETDVCSRVCDCIYLCSECRGALIDSCRLSAHPQFVRALLWWKCSVTMLSADKWNAACLLAEKQVNLWSQMLLNWWKENGGRNYDWLMDPESSSKIKKWKKKNPSLRGPSENTRAGKYGLWESTVCPNRMHVSHSACPQTLSVSQMHPHKHMLAHRMHGNRARVALRLSQIRIGQKPHAPHRTIVPPASNGRFWRSHKAKRRFNFESAAEASRQYRVMVTNSLPSWWMLP